MVCGMNTGDRISIQNHLVFKKIRLTEIVWELWFNFQDRRQSVLIWV